MMNAIPRSSRVSRTRIAVALLLGLALEAVVGLLVAASPAVATLLQPSEGTQTSQGGQVTVSVTWTGSPDELAFAVVMDTHAVDLDGYDLLQLAVLRTTAGVEVQPTVWDAPPGGHHREGTLSFPTTSADGNPVIEADTRTFELAIRDVAGVPERVFRWEW